MKNVKLWFSTLVCYGLIGITKVLAQSAQTPEQAATDFSNKAITILRGPIAKVLGVVILITGVASLLRGRHKLAISCALAFVLLLFMPMFLGQLGVGK